MDNFKREKATEMCGQYERGTEFQAKIQYCRFIDEFYFKIEVLTADHLESMKITSKIKYRSGELMCAARPYKIDIGQIKLVSDSNQKENMLRCEIRDMYTENNQGQLEVIVSVLLIDKGFVWYRVPLARIFDFPQSINHYQDIEREAKCFTLPLDLRNEKMKQDFINKTFNLVCRVKILDYKEGRYVVDLIDNQNKSLIDHLKKHFKTEIPLEPTKPKIVHYSGAAHYFRDKLIKNYRDKTLSLMKKQLFRVKITTWSGPNAIYIVPDDSNLILSHEKFQRDLDLYQDSSDIGIQESYEEGEYCLFLNKVEPGLGKWLRGIIVDGPHIDENGIYTSQGGGHCKAIANGYDFMYYVRSIDYGFPCLRQKINLRPVGSNKMFHKRGTWSLRCKLFGIKPFSHIVNSKGEPIFSENCFESMDQWLREKILDSGRSTPFHILFRTNISKLPPLWIPDELCPEITLFNRFEPRNTVENCYIPPRGRRFECLNYELFDSGLAADQTNNGKSSNIALDNHVINLMVRL